MKCILSSTLALEAPFYESTDRNAENAGIDLLVCIFYIFVRAMLTRTYFVASWVQFPWIIVEYFEYAFMPFYSTPISVTFDPAPV